MKFFLLLESLLKFFFLFAQVIWALEGDILQFCCKIQPTYITKFESKFYTREKRELVKCDSDVNKQNGERNDSNLYEKKHKNQGKKITKALPIVKIKQVHAKSANPLKKCVFCFMIFIIPSEIRCIHGWKLKFVIRTYLRILNVELIEPSFRTTQHVCIWTCNF